MVITEKNETGKMFGPIKTCIYCGATTNGSRRLQDEHIFPFCLGGVSQILEASCDECAKHTSAAEGKCAELIFKRLRRREGIKSRRKLKPATMPLTIYNQGKTRIVDVPIELIPTSIELPILDPPGIYTGRPLDYQPRVITKRTTIVDREDAIANFIGAVGWMKWEYTYEYPLMSIFRLLAKIAHCHATATIGYGRFRPLLTPFILGGDMATVPYYMGCFDPPGPQRHKLKAHRIQSRPIDLVPGGKPIVACDIQLFADYGTPYYGIAVGELL